MTCEQIREMLADALGDELGPSDRATFDLHLRSCTTCRGEYDSLARTLGAIRTLRQVPPSPILTGVAGRTASSTPTRSRLGFRPFAWARYAAVIVLAFSAGFLARGSGDQTPAGRPTTGANGVHRPHDGMGVTTREALANAHRGHPRATMMTKLMIALHSGDRG